MLVHITLRLHNNQQVICETHMTDLAAYINGNAGESVEQRFRIFETEARLADPGVAYLVPHTATGAQQGERSGT